jgi:hypothetical protein
VRHDRTGELVDDDQVPDVHRCTNGWDGEDHLGRPIPCPICKADLIRRQQARRRSVTA